MCILSEYRRIESIKYNLVSMNIVLQNLKGNLICKKKCLVFVILCAHFINHYFRSILISIDNLGINPVCRYENKYSTMNRDKANLTKSGELSDSPENIQQLCIYVKIQ